MIRVSSLFRALNRTHDIPPIVMETPRALQPVQHAQIESQQSSLNHQHNLHAQCGYRNPIY